MFFPARSPVYWIQTCISCYLCNNSAALIAYMNGGVFNYLTTPSYQLHLKLPVLFLIAWGKVFSILTDFSFFGKGPEGSWDSCKFDDFFSGGQVRIFEKRNSKFWEDPDLFKSCWFLCQSPIHLWNVSMLVSIYTPKPPSSSIRITTLTGDIVWPTFNSRKCSVFDKKKNTFTFVIVKLGTVVPLEFEKHPHANISQFWWPIHILKWNPKQTHIDIACTLSCWIIIEL